MTLARGESSAADERLERPPAGDGGAMVIAIAASTEERVHLASLVNGHAPVFLVASREEAASLLASDPPPEVPTLHHIGERLSPPPAAGSLVLEVDSDRRVAMWSGRSAPLSPLEHDVLQCLLAQLGHTCRFESLHREVWGNDHLGRRADVWSVVKRLRRKFDQLDCPFQIQAVRGVGVRLVNHSESRQS
jgi:Transcriptional regulatory protein, C terminal